MAGFAILWRPVVTHAQRARHRTPVQGGPNFWRVTLAQSFNTTVQDRALELPWT